MSIVNTYTPIWLGQCEDLRLNNSQESLNYFKALSEIYEGVRIALTCYQQGLSRKHSRGFYRELLADLIYHANVNWSDLLLVLVLAFAWTYLRKCLIDTIFLPLGRWAGVLQKNQAKFSESAWKTVAYLSMWSLSCYVTFFRGYDFFWDTSTIWSHLKECRQQWDITLVYIVELSFYLHSLYATLYMDAWRKDSPAMISHHLITLWLIGFSYAYSYMKIGLIIFVLDDISDVILEAGKVMTYLRVRVEGTNKSLSRVFSVASQVMSVIFAVQWLILRVYLHITKVQWTASYQVWHSLETPQPAAVGLVFNLFLGILYVLYVYWFLMIVHFVVRVLTSENPETVEDVREEGSDHVVKMKKN